MNPAQLERYHGVDPVEKRANLTRPDPFAGFLKFAQSPSFRRFLKHPISPAGHSMEGPWTCEPHNVLELDAQVQREFQTFGGIFQPPSEHVALVAVLLILLFCPSAAPF